MRQFIIQGEIDCYFANKLHLFHQNFVEEMLLCGVSDATASIDRVKMSKNPKYSIKYYKKIIGGLLKFEPLTSILARDSYGQKLAECTVNHLNDERFIFNNFLVQKVYKWEGSDSMSTQVWKLKNKPIYCLKQYWRL